MYEIFDGFGMPAKSGTSNIVQPLRLPIVQSKSPPHNLPHPQVLPVHHDPVVINSRRVFYEIQGNGILSGREMMFIFANDCLFVKLKTEILISPDLWHFLL